MLAALLVGTLALQDISELVAKLSDDDIRVREDATQKLILLGEPALEAVKKAVASEEAEVRERATRIVRDIERNLKIAKIYQPPVPITLAGKKSIQDALDLIGVRAPEAGEMTFDLKDATPFDLLDAVCKELKDTNYTVDSGGVRFTKDPFVEIPSDSIEAFRTRVVKIEKYSATTFTKTDFAWSVQLTGDVLPQVKTTGNPSVVLTEVVDGQGTKAKQTEELFVMGAGDNAQIRQWMQSMKQQLLYQRSLGTRVYTFASDKNLDSIQMLKGFTTHFFRIDPCEIRFEIPAQRAESDAGEYRLNAQKMPRGKAVTLMITLIPKKASSAAGGLAQDLVDRDSFEGIDAEGNALKIDVQNISVTNQQVDGQLVQCPYIYIDLSKAPNAREVRFKVSSFYRKDVPFEIRNLKLP